MKRFLALLTALCLLAACAAAEGTDATQEVAAERDGDRLLMTVENRAAETADRAAFLAVKDMERQMERELSAMRGEHTYGVPSRRLPEELRPNPPGDEKT